MPQLVELPQIKTALDKIETSHLISVIEAGFVAYSKGQVVVPPVGYLRFDTPPGETHIKYGYVRNDDYYVIKIASGFYDNPGLGLSSSNGLMLVFSQKTGELLSILLDEGFLTDVRTALAGAVVARHLAPAKVKGIGIVGTGIQARLQLEYLKGVIDCQQVVVYGRNTERLNAYATEMSAAGFEITTTQAIRELTSRCNYIVTTTPATQPVLLADQIEPGTHITAVGADATGKQELEATILNRADLVIADSLEQCIDHGEISQADYKTLMAHDKLFELGDFISKGLGRTKEDQITVADLTGVAIQDIQIAKLIYQNL